MLSVMAALLLNSHAHANEACAQQIPGIIKGEFVLPSDCVFEKPLKINEGNTTLDCNGSVFDGRNIHGLNKAGLTIDSEGRKISNITVRNCVFRNFKGGIRITWNKADSEKRDDRKAIYERTPSNVNLDNLIVEENDGVGIYIDDYVTGVVVQDSSILRNKGVGIYLEHSTQKNTIRNNRIIGNGVRSGRASREGIAIDSSAENSIENNYFENNAAGGIFIYKNCGETPDKGYGDRLIRWQHSNNNRIASNKFVNEKTGIWIASRQSRNLESWGCADKPMDEDGKYFQDFANGNLIFGNVFHSNETGIRIEGDYNEAKNNVFYCSKKNAIDIPITKREELMKKPQIGNVIYGNEIIKCDK